MTRTRPPTCARLLLSTLLLVSGNSVAAELPFAFSTASPPHTSRPGLRSQADMLSAYAYRLDIADTAPMRPHPVATIGLTIAGLSGLALAHTHGRHDKIDHITAGYLVGLSASGIYTLKLDANDSRWVRFGAFMLGVASSAAVGALKEEYDSHSDSGQVDDVDIYATIGGGVGGALTISLIDWLFL